MFDGVTSVHYVIAQFSAMLNVSMIRSKAFYPYCTNSTVISDMDLKNNLPG